MLDRLDRRLENEVPYASSVTSLVNLNIPIGNDEGFDVANPFEEVIPTDPQELAEKIGECDIIFNTVPHCVLDFKALSVTKPNVLIIDLASRPGGVDFETAKELERRVIWALSLPGKVAPYTAGRIIKDTIMNIIEELGVEDRWKEY